MENNLPKYPSDILPQLVYKERLEINEIRQDCDGCWLQRRREDFSWEDGCYPEVLTPESFGCKLVGLSVNLMGGLFKPHHIKFEPSGICDWDYTKDTCEVDKILYDYNANNEGIYIRASVHEKTFPSARRFDNEAAYNAVKNALVDKFKKFRKDEAYDVSYQISVRHCPTVQNYWHWQIHISPLGYHNYVNKDKSKWQSEAFRSLVNFLMGYSTLEIPRFGSIPEEVYLRTD